MSLIFPLGCLPDHKDERDYKLDHPTAKQSIRIAFEAQEAARCGQEFTAVDIPVKRPVRTQVGNSCVANAWCMAVEILSDNSAHRSSNTKLSSQHLYWCARHYEGRQDKDEGTQIRLGAKVFANVGVCPEQDWPDSYEHICEQPPASAFVHAYDAKIQHYYRASNLFDVEYALRAWHPVVIGIPVGQEFFQYQGQQPQSALSPPRNIVGYHAVCVVGLRCGEQGREWKIVNSWGSAWGRGGFAILNEEYMHTALDMWVATAPPF